MIRVVATSIVLSCLAAPAWAQSAQTQTAPTAAATHAGKPAAAKPGSNAKTATRPLAPAGSRPCSLGVIPVIGDSFGMKKIGLTVFGNESDEASIDSWGLDDLVVARVRAAAGPDIEVRRIAYANGSFAPYDHPSAQLFRRPEDDLTAIVRQIASNSNCERYVVVTKYQAEFGGTNQTVKGVSVVSQGIGDLIRHTYVVAYAQVRIFDGRSFAIRKPSVSLESVMKSSFTGQRGPVREIDNASFPTSVGQAAASAKLRDESRALLAETLDKTLPALLRE